MTHHPAVLCCFLVSGALAAPLCASAADLRTENVVYVMLDGFRHQEVFSGAEEPLIQGEGGDLELARMRFWRATPEARREALLPFFWKVVAKEGQVFGDQERGSVAQVANPHKFSYPGYSETLCGVADPAVDSNKKIHNRHLNVLEWLHGQKPYAGRVAAFGAWDLFPFILNQPRSGMVVNAGYAPFTEGKITPTIATINRLKDGMTRYWKGEPFDALPYETALEYLKTRKPRVLFLSLGETDEWGHDNRYDLYLESAHLADGYIRTIWETLQSLPQYRGKTTLMLSTDHGRGLGPDGWQGHGKDLPNSENIWMAFMGPDTPALGVRADTGRVTAGQMTATLAAFLGKDYLTAVPEAAPPVPGVTAGKN